MDLTHLSFAELSSAIQSKKISAVDTATFFRERIERLNPSLNAFTSLNEGYLAEAQKIDEKIHRGETVGRLAGIPFGIKEMFCTQGLKTTAASKILENFIPPYDATAVARLKAAGAVIMGKLNQDEFAMGSSNETSFYGSVKNPWNIACVPGGSSGGSAAAQAARLVAGTLGTDTGGSIRQPASFCGVVGVKPTYGRISRYGIIAYASSLDQAGPMVSSVTDAALSLETMAGYDERDSTSSPQVVPNWTADLSENIKGRKIGVIKEIMSAGALHPDVEKTLTLALTNLKSLGAELVEVSLPHISYAVPVYYLIAASEASSNLSRYDGVKYGYRAEFANLSNVTLEEFYGKTRGEGFGPEVKRRIMLGTYCLSADSYEAYYVKASKVRRLIANDYLEAFKKCDVLLSPVATTPAFKLGERISDPLAMYLNDVFTTATNLAGLPGMSLPYGISQDGLPIGVQLTAKHFDEQTMLNVAYALEPSAPAQGVRPHVI